MAKMRGIGGMAVACAAALLLSGCSTPDFWQRFAFQALQGFHHQQCIRNPAMECGHEPTYDQYQRDRRQVADGR